jgi:hypothetical protein
VHGDIACGRNTGDPIPVSLYDSQLGEEKEEVWSRFGLGKVSAISYETSKILSVLFFPARASVIPQIIV